MLISIVIPTYNGEKTLPEVFSKIASQRTKNDFEIVCIDSSSQDNTLSICQKYAQRIISIPRKEFNHGLTRDRGIENSRGEAIILLTQDAVPADEYWLDNLIKPIVNERDVAGAYSRHIPSADCSPLTKHKITYALEYSLRRREHFIKNYFSYFKLNLLDKYSLYYFSNASSCIRRMVWKKIRFGKRDFGEDMAWAKGVLEAGYKIIFEPSSAIIHSHNYTAWQYFKRIYVDHKNLNGLIGLRLIPSFPKAIYCGIREMGFFWSAIQEEAALGRKDKLYWQIHAIPHAILDPLAQYLGASSNGNNNKINLLGGL